MISGVYWMLAGVVMILLALLIGALRWLRRRARRGRERGPREGGA